MNKRKIFIEAVPLVDHQVSGVPHALAGIVAALAANKAVQQMFELVLVAPKNRLQLLDRWPGLETCTRKAIPMKFRIMNGLGRRGLLPKMDLLLGPGIYLFGNYFNWPLTRRSRSLTYLHDICFMTHPELVQPENQRMLAKNVPRYLRQADYVIAVSHTAKQSIVKALQVAPEKVVVVHNAVDTTLFSQAFTKEDIAEVQRKYGVEGQKYFYFIGNIEPRKNLERLLRALMTLPIEYGMVFVGSDGWLNEQFFALVEKARAQGRTVVKPSTYVDDHDAARLLHGSLGLVWPSIDEGFGMPPLESLAAGKPTVVSTIPQFKETVGDAGIYCDPFNEASIASALQHVIALSPNQRHALAKKGRERVALFAWDKSAARLTELLITVDKELGERL
jgi:glycosyltransferase involved in cell wall biosynthesis